jgi:predicted nucleic acid-binding protein
MMIFADMRCFTDTSFLCALLREQDNTMRADTFMERFKGQIIVSSQVLWEFRQSARFQVFRHNHDKSKGFTKKEAERMLHVLSHNVDSGVLHLATVDWQDVHSIAETLSATYTMKGGHRPMDIIHIATAKHLRLRHFLTFDANQKKLALSENFQVPV